MPLTGTSPAIAVRSGGSEGSWYYNTGTTVHIPGCVVGDSIFAWIGITSPSSVSATHASFLASESSWPISGQSSILVYLLRCTTAGTVVITVSSGTGYILAHKPPVPAINAP